MRIIGLMQSNRLLSSLSRKDRRQLIAACDEINLGVGDELWNPHKRIRQVYFPLDCTISQLLPMDSHKILELALIGNEGMLGVPLLLGVNHSMLHAIVKQSGTALRLSAASFRRELEHFPALQQQLTRYAYVLDEQLAQSMACVSRHTLDVRLARLLLMTHDRVVGLGSFHVTHQALAKTLCVRRVGVTIAAGLLQKRKLLSYSRGEVTILNRAGLERVSCGCYQASKDMYERVLG